ncbi:MAG TPA: BTAD domain-containing putative transcriptional regulator [Gemmatimonadales bacterium]|nr:BTAD domain-containing putative transcriptional regulator [Gemmatimonadales bacterium]
MLYLQTFGRLAVTAEGQPLAGAASQPRRLALLAMLACAGERGLTREKLLAFFWPDADEERGRRGLSQAVYALRQDLGNEEVIVGSKDLRINSDVLRSDVAEFGAAGSGGQWERAAALYAGPFLDGFHLPSAPEFERWAEEQRAGFAREYTEALERLARAATGRGEHLASVGWWRKLAGQDPLNARVATGLMQALVAAGDRNGALQHARIYEALVEQELNLPPDRDVVALAERIRTEPAPPAAQPPPTPAPLRPATEPAAAQPVAAQPVAATEPAAAPRAAAAPLSGAEPGVRSTLPASLREAAGRFLQYHPSGRVKTTAEWLAVLAGQRGARQLPWWRRRSTWVVGAGAVALVGTVAMLLVGRRGATLVPGATQRVAFDGALELDPAISPDGRVVAYASDQSGDMRLYVRQGAGGRAVPITQSVPGYHRWPRWSPDGSRIAFHAERSIYVVPALGGTPQILVRAPPGGWVAQHAWSPDGRELAYVQNDTMFATDVASGARRMITDTAGFSPAWSPDGRWIAFASGNAAFTFGGTVYGSPLNLGNVAPSSIWVVAAKGGAPVRVTDDAALNVSPAWLPDDGGILFVSDRNGSRDIYRAAFDPSGKPTSVEQLTTGLDAQTITVAADGRRIAYSVFRYSANVWSVEAVGDRPVSVGEARPVTSGGQIIEGLALAPNGDWLAYDTDLNGNQDIYKVPLEEGADAIQLTSDPRNDFVSSWAPNGNEIAFYSFRRGTRRVQVMAADGGPSAEVAEAPSNQRSPDWSPDGRMLAFSAGEPGEHQIYLTARSGSSGWAVPKQLSSRPGGRAGSPRWSPDGSVIAFKDDEGIWLVAPDGGEPRPLLRYARPEDPRAEVLQWSRDGRTVYYKAFDPTGRSVIAAVPAAGGTPRDVVRFDDPLRQSTRPEFATDGRRFFFTIGTRISDVWEMTLDRR